MLPDVSNVWPQQIILMWYSLFFYINIRLADFCVICSYILSSFFLLWKQIHNHVNKFNNMTINHDFYYCDEDILLDK